MPTDRTINRDWIAAEFSKGIEAKQALQDDATATAEAPPDPALGLLYHEIAAADARHKAIIETIATRYGHNLTKGGGIGLGEDAQAPQRQGERARRLASAPGRARPRRQGLLDPLVHRLGPGLPGDRRCPRAPASWPPS